MNDGDLVNAACEAHGQGQQSVLHDLKKWAEYHLDAISMGTRLDLRALLLRLCDDRWLDDLSHVKARSERYEHKHRFNPDGDCACGAWEGR